MVLSYLIPYQANIVPDHIIQDWEYKVLNHSKLDWANKVLSQLLKRMNIVLSYLVLDQANTVLGHII